MLTLPALLLPHLGTAAIAKHAAAPIVAAGVVQSAQTIPADMPLEDALQAVGVRPAVIMGATQLLADLGLYDRLDLQLLGGGPEATELIESLSGSQLSLGDRSKIRLLVGARVHLARLAASEQQHKHTFGGDVQTSPQEFVHDDFDDFDDDHNMVDALGTFHRRVQETDSGGLSGDTIAIVFSVLVGAAGYMVQVRH
eukprot:SAG31_NODE_5247_length_2652_cov_2.071680_3_plen_197_part_00